MIFLKIFQKRISRVTWFQWLILSNIQGREKLIQNFFLKIKETLPTYFKASRILILKKEKSKNDILKKTEKDLKIVAQHSS